MLKVIYLKITIAIIAVKILYHLTSNAVYNNLAFIINSNTFILHFFKVNKSLYLSMEFVIYKDIFIHFHPHFLKLVWREAQKIHLTFWLPLVRAFHARYIKD